MRLYRQKKKILTCFIVAFLCIFGGFACSNLPDVQPFAESTWDLYQGMYYIQEMTAQLLKEYEKGITIKIDGQEVTGRAHELFLKYWEPRMNAVELFVNYSDSLAAIVSSTKANEEKINSYVDITGGLITAFGGAEIPEAVANLAKTIVIEEEKLRAMKELYQTIKATHPSIKKLTDALQTEFDKLDDRLLDIGQQLEVGIADHYWVGLRNQIKRRIVDASGEISNVETQIYQLQEKKKNNPPETERTKLEKELKDLIEQRLALKKEVKDLIALLAQVPDLEKKLSQSISNAKKMILITKAAFERWEITHRQMGEEIFANRQPNFRILTFQSEMITKFIEEVNKQ